MSLPLALSGAYAVLLLAFVAAAAAGSGRRAIGLLGVEDAGEREKTWAGAALGLGFLSLGTMALGVLGLLRAPFAAGLLAGLLLWGWPEIKAALSGFRGPFERPVLAGFALFLALGLLFVCLMPPHQYDSLVYHLALPETYAREGRLVSPPHLLYSHFPQNAEMLFTLALILKSDLLAQMMMWLSTAACLGLAFEAGLRELGPGAAWAALFLAATHTAVMLLATVTYVEPLVMLWTCAAVLSCWRGLGAGSGRRGWLTLSALFSGLALGTKYTAGATAALLALAAAARPLFLREGGVRLRDDWKDPARFVLIATAVFLPWLVKNFLVIGNPVFPFLYTWFPMTGSGWGAETAQRYFRILAEYGHGESWVRDFVTLPYQLLVMFSRYGGGMDVLGCLGWSLVLTASPLALWPAFGRGQGRRPSAPAALGKGVGGPGSPFLMFLLAYCLSHFLVWFATGTVLRFLTAIAPLLALLAAAGLARLWTASGAGVRVCVVAACAVMTATNLGYFLYVHRVLETGSVLLGRETREAFLSRRLDYYPCAAWGRENLAPNDRILLVGEQRAYYLGRGHVASTVNAPNRWVGLANEAESPEDLGRKLKAEGLTKVLFVPREMRRLFPALGPLTDKGFGNLSGLPGGRAPVFTAPRCGVFSL